MITVISRVIIIERNHLEMIIQWENSYLKEIKQSCIKYIMVNKTTL